MSATIEREAATKPPLEPEALGFADATANPPFLYDQRKLLTRTIRTNERLLNPARRTALAASASAELIQHDCRGLRYSTQLPARVRAGRRRTG